MSIPVELAETAELSLTAPKRQQVEAVFAAVANGRDAPGEAALEM